MVPVGSVVELAGTRQALERGIPFVLEPGTSDLVPAGDDPLAVAPVVLPSGGSAASPRPSPRRSRSRSSACSPASPTRRASPCTSPPDRSGCGRARGVSHRVSETGTAPRVEHFVHMRSSSRSWRATSRRWTWTRSPTRPTTVFGWAQVSPARSSGPGATRSSARRWRRARSRRRRGRDRRGEAARPLGDPRRGDGPGPADVGEAIESATREPSSSRTSSAPNRWRCRPSAPASAASRWTSARGSWSPRLVPTSPGRCAASIFAVYGPEAEAAFRNAL